jgi:hypothetical protein
MEIDPEVVKLALGGSAGLETGRRVLGPTLDYAGQRTLELAKGADTRLAKVVSRAWERRLANGNPPGSTPPRVARAIIDEAVVTDDEVMAEYLSGLLALSVSEDPTDDLALGNVALIKQLSTPAIRLHFQIYRRLHELMAGSDVSVGANQMECRLFVSWPDIARAASGERSAPTSIIAVAFPVLLELSRLDLVDHLSTGTVEQLEKAEGQYQYPGSGGAIIAPTVPGASLLTASMGVSLNGNALGLFPIDYPADIRSKLANVVFLKDLPLKKAPAG